MIVKTMLSILLLTIATFGNYKGAYDQYILAKNQFSQYNTGATRQEAIAKTQTVLIQRNRLIIEYLQSINSVLTPDINQIVIELESWEKDVKAADTVPDINKIAKSWEDKLERITKLSNAARVLIASARLGLLQDQLQTFSFPDNINKTNAKLYEQKLQLAKSKRLEAESKLVNWQENYWGIDSLFSYLRESQDALNSASQLIYEVTPRP